MSRRLPVRASAKRAIVWSAAGLVLFVVGIVVMVWHAGEHDGESNCFGTPAHGRLVAGVRLPRRGDNFRMYSDLGWLLGRTYVHGAVSSVVLAAFRDLAQSDPTLRFVIGETGWSSGGRFRPHRTHQNGLSVDFMVPVVDTRGAPGELDTGWFEKLGYGVEFDAQGRNGDVRIDFAAVSALLAALATAAKRQDVRIDKVIFDPVLRRALETTPSWRAIRALPFVRGQVWVRHDEHVHVDFGVPCGAM